MNIKELAAETKVSQSKIIDINKAMNFFSRHLSFFHVAMQPTLRNFSFVFLLKISIALGFFFSSHILEITEQTANLCVLICLSRNGSASIIRDTSAQVMSSC